MKLPDTNVLIYAVNISSRQHRVAIEWLKAAFSEPAGVGLAWVALLGFLRITTRAGILSKPLSLEEALGVLKFWLAQPRARVLHPGEHHVDVIGRLLAAIGTAGNLASDAHLAAPLL